MIESQLGGIEYDEVGTGPTVVLVPGSCSTGAAWRPVVSRWKGEFRCVTTSLLGYGRTAERRTAGNTDISHEAEVLEAVIHRTGGSVHLVGHSYGGLTALAVAIRNRVSLQSLVILEAPVPDVLRGAGEHPHSRSFREMTGAYFAAFEAGDQTAIRIMIDFFGGSGTFAGWPERVRDYAVQTTPVNLLDWQTASGFLLPPAVLARVGVPTLVACGGESNSAMRRANELLAEGIPDASLVTVAGASHFMISTHPGEVAGLIDRHVGAAQRGLHEHIEYRDTANRYAENTHMAGKQRRVRHQEQRPWVSSTVMPSAQAHRSTRPRRGRLSPARSLSKPW